MAFAVGGSAARAAVTSVKAACNSLSRWRREFGYETGMALSFQRWRRGYRESLEHGVEFRLLKMMVVKQFQERGIPTWGRQNLEHGGNHRNGFGHGITSLESVLSCLSWSGRAPPRLRASFASLRSA